MSKKEKNPPWFIHDQVWQILVAANDQRKHLSPANVRTRGESEESSPEAIEPNTASSHTSVWEKVEHEQVAFNVKGTFDDQNHELDFRLLAITSDAGIGKSAATEWLEYRINHPQPFDASQTDAKKGGAASNGVDANGSIEKHANIARNPADIAFRFNLQNFVLDHRLKDSNLVELEDRVLNGLVKVFQTLLAKKDIQPNPNEIETDLRGSARRGEICFIFDALDQTSATDLRVIEKILDLPLFRLCRFVVAGRPNAIVSEGRWDELFANRPWTYIKVEEFDRPQQIRYLSWLPPISKSDVESGNKIPQVDRIRYRKIHRDARSILSVPRILSYLRKKDNFSGIRTAADIYHDSIDHLLHLGLRNCLPVEQKIQDAQINDLKKILAITAYESHAIYQPGDVKFWPKSDEYSAKNLSHLPSRPGDPPAEYEYNIKHKDGDFEDIKKRICEKSGLTKEQFEEDWTLLGKLNTLLEQGIFDDDDREGLNRIVWANKSLHEFLLAYYFSKFSSPHECDRLWDWIYLNDVVETDQYYPFWQFLCDMPSQARDSMRWLNCIEMIFWPGVELPNHSDPTDDKSPHCNYPFFSKRSTEMIYRAWQTLAAYCADKKPDVKTRANTIRDRWREEFETKFLKGENWHYLSSNWIERIQSIANAQRNDLLQIPSGTLHMGTLWRKQVSETDAEIIESELRAFCDQPEAKITSFFGQFSDYMATRSGKAYRDDVEPKIRAAIRMYRDAVNAGDRSAAIELFMNSRYVQGNEFEFKGIPIEEFQLGRRTTTNQWFRLFKSAHFAGDSDYGHYSETSQHPVIGTSFFDAWTYCQWLRWEGHSCRLPWETEWEYAAKLGFSAENWHQSYWWSDSFEAETDPDHALINCKEQGFGRTLAASALRASEASKQLDERDGEGLMDLLGNHWEWCQDIYRYRFEIGKRQIDSKISPTPSRVVRGGSFLNYAIRTRCSNRNHSVPAFADRSNGFRVARAEN